MMISNCFRVMSAVVLKRHAYQHCPIQHQQLFSYAKRITLPSTTTPATTSNLTNTTNLSNLTNNSNFSNTTSATPTVSTTTTTTKSTTRKPKTTDKSTKSSTTPAKKSSKTTSLNVEKPIAQRHQSHSYFTDSEINQHEQQQQQEQQLLTKMEKRLLDYQRRLQWKQQQKQQQQQKSLSTTSNPKTSNTKNTTKTNNDDQFVKSTTTTTHWKHLPVMPHIRNYIERVQGGKYYASSSRNRIDRKRGNSVAAPQSKSVLFGSTKNVRNKSKLVKNGEKVENEEKVDLRERETSQLYRHIFDNKKVKFITSTNRPETIPPPFPSTSSSTVTSNSPTNEKLKVEKTKSCVCLAEVAFAGRSNVGKSSLLNSLVHSRGKAQVGDRPGLTQSIQFFNVNQMMMLVDLPGYGFAFSTSSSSSSFVSCLKNQEKQSDDATVGKNKKKKGKKIEKRESANDGVDDELTATNEDNSDNNNPWHEFVKLFLYNRYHQAPRPLKRVFVLIDARHGLKSSDYQFLQFLTVNKIQNQIVLTKNDLVPGDELAKKMYALELAMNEDEVTFRYTIPHILLASSKSGSGVREIQRVLTSFMEPQKIAQVRTKLKMKQIQEQVLF